ncbi:MAG: CBS domain-containing protein [bacterium]|nr:CBS domain-containing protein [bacterium]
MKFEEAIKKEKIRDVIVPRGIRVKKETPYGQVVAKLQAEHKFCAIILDGNKILGIFTERDALMRGLLQKTDPATPIEKIMTPDPVTIQEEDSVARAIRLMYEGKYRHLPVVNSKQEFTGLISVRDIVYYLSENYPYEVYNLPPDPHKHSATSEGA